MLPPEMIAVDRFNPFGVNRVGIGGPGFPLSITLDRRHGIEVVHGTGLRAVDMAPLLVAAAQPISLVFNLGHTALMDSDHRILSPSAVAEEQGVQADVIDVGWASFNPAAGAELLALETTQLPRFFEGWSLYDVDVLDYASPPTSSEVDEAVLAVNARRRDDPPVLTTVSGSTVYFGGHDDCYFYIESRAGRLGRRVFSRLLALMVGSALITEADEVARVAEPPDDVITQRLFDDSEVWTGTALRRRDDVAVELTPAEWSLDKPIPSSPTHSVLFDPDAGRWSLEAHSAEP